MQRLTKKHLGLLSSMGQHSPPKGPATRLLGSQMFIGCCYKRNHVTNMIFRLMLLLSNVWHIMFSIKKQDVSLSTFDVFSMFHHEWIYQFIEFLFWNWSCKIIPSECFSMEFLTYLFFCVYLRLCIKTFLGGYVSHPQRMTHNRLQEMTSKQTCSCPSLHQPHWLQRWKSI